MKDLSEALAHFATITSAGFAQAAPGTAPGQRPQATVTTFYLYGYFVGEDSDTLLCGHPDLVY
ncbi:hypothetical protein [Hymenobacter coccineus]|uniref:Uncharacterized protein n=1 Tax=Hymenobacter coccineus TaxID=1908235 RepID=A0A1G1SY76_9BACT|nr:hypothetical protein [Hymenobacter coccineus]OGX83587.1 hypothetical protein BEN49_02230 [Hymenobacter coccineus]